MWLDANIIIKIYSQIITVAYFPDGELASKIDCDVVIKDLDAKIFRSITFKGKHSDVAFVHIF